jgi:dTDP-4-amino-4,6-dideoxy-D-galactose acyltransferase
VTASHPAIERLPWDSEFFGMPIARLHLDRVDRNDMRKAVDHADADGIRCLCLLAPARDTAQITEAEALGFRLYDVRVELERELSGRESAPPGIRPAREADYAAIEQIARSRFRDTRFFNDPHFPRERSADIYAAWLERAWATAPRRRVLVTDAKDGFVVVELDQGRGTGAIELIAVDEGATRRRAGSALVAAANATCAAAGLRQVRVVTQGANIAAQRLYQVNGYLSAATSLWLHRWLPNRAAPRSRQAI